MLSICVYKYLSSTNSVSVNIVFIANGLYGNIQIFFFYIADGTARVACLLIIILLIHLTPYCVRTFMV